MNRREAVFAGGDHWQFRRGGERRDAGSAGGVARALAVAVTGLAALAGAGCDLSPFCAAEYTIGGTCAGVSKDPVCEGDACTSGIACDATVTVGDAAALAGAAKEAQAGTCIVLSPGTYPAVTLPGGVRLLGRGADFVTVAGITAGAGPGTVIRGLTVTAGGVVLDGATGAALRSVRVDGGDGSGIVLRNGASASVLGSTISGAAGYGIDALGAAGLTVTDSVIEGTGGPGVWVECEAGCACAQKPSVFLTRTIVRGATYVGVALSGATATLTEVRISESAQLDFQFGGGLSVAACSSVTAAGLAVLDNADFGVLVHASSATLGQTGDGNGLVVSGNLRGLWAQEISGPEPQTVHVENASVTNNRGVGVGFGGETVGFIICKSAIDGTALTTLPVDVGGSGDVGDGIVWMEGSQAELEEVTVSNSARASVLIDGEVGSGSTLKDITLAAGDAQKAILQQNLPAGGATPQSQGGVPAIQTTSDQPYAVAIPPLVPATP